MKTNNAQNLKALPAGYKQTEVGIIPDDWKVSNIGDLCVIFGRIGFRGYTKADIVSQDQGVLSISPSNIFNGRTNFIHGTYITRQKYEESPEIKIYEDDILLVKTGSTYGKIALVKNLKEDATLNPQVVVLKRLKCPAAFLAYIMQFDIVQNQIEETIVGGAIPTLSQKVVLNYKIPLPSPKEQVAIANVLSDIDALITKIEQLIEKKRAIKIAAMQQLLTGRTRLPKFSKHTDSTVKDNKTSELGRIPKDWDTVLLKDIATVKGGKRLPKGEVLVSSPNAHPYIRVTDMNDDGIDISNVLYVPEHIAHVIKNYKIFSGELFISVAGTLGIVGQVPHSLNGANLTENADRICQIKADPIFIKYWLQGRYIQDEIASKSTIGAQPKLALGRIENFVVPLPRLYEEQTAIATVLSDIDSELTLLGQKLAKACDIKQGMMQQLLTGRIRLPLDQLS
ncbi:restriction endonuclease subunit S [Serratia liquefaciens]|uniref:restriction endonuclease subunit S n=1 Tax=Serratia liquefaciens TaxID=614 RepID=UPI0021C5B9DB|nr:restriction endonuclease subunit S [Serratia liquefaciens]